MTSVLPAPAPTALATVQPRSSLSTVAVLRVALVLVVLLQRFAVPVGTEGISITLVIAAVVLLVLVSTGRLVHDVTAAVLFGVSLAACGVTTWFSAAANTDLSLGSFLLLCVVYLPWVFRVPDRATSVRGAHLAARTFTNLMLLLGFVSIGQLGSQLLGLWSYRDPIGDVVPEQWLVGNYNISTATQYASPIYRSQAFVFLEPSFLSQFLALAIIIGILRRDPAWKLLVLGVGMFCTYSGTGIVLLVAGLVLILIRDPRRLRLGLVVIAGVAVAAVLSTPYAAPLLARTGEASNSASSLSLRFVLPYDQVAQGLSEDPGRYLVGAGPGSAERLLENARQGTGLAVVYTIAPKVIFEYGVPAGVLFLIFLGCCLFRGPPHRVVPGALVVMLGLLSGSLLQPHTLLVAWLLSVVWSRDPVPVGDDRPGTAQPS